MPWVRVNLASGGGGGGGFVFFFWPYWGLGCFFFLALVGVLVFFFSFSSLVCSALNCLPVAAPRLVRGARLVVRALLSLAGGVHPGEPRPLKVELVVVLPVRLFALGEERGVFAVALEELLRVA